MNKKFMSLVLAAVFTISLGSNGWAYSYTGDKSSGGGTITMSNVYNQEGTGDISRSGGSGQYGISGTEEMTNRLCAVFNYASGVVLSVMDQDKNLTLYNAGSAFLSLTYNEAEGNQGFGNYTVSSISMSGSDYINMMAKGGMVSFLKELGVFDSQLQCSQMTSDGEQIKVDNDTQVQVGWIDAATNHLSKGVNHSISINFTASGGASVTLSVNGKAMETLGYDYGQIDYAPIAVYNYNAAGTLETIEQKTYTVSDVDSSGTGTGSEKQVDNVSYEVSYTTVHMDEYGRQSYATDVNGNTVTTYAYSSTGSIASVHDLTTNSTTYYSGGKAGFVINDSGFKTTEYFYHENGSLDGVKSYNFDQDTGAVTTTSISAYRYGKFIGSADLSNIQPGQPTNFDELRAAIDYVKLNPDTWKSAYIDGSANLSDSDIATTIDGQSYTWNGSGWIDSSGNQVTNDEQEDGEDTNGDFGTVTVSNSVYEQLTQKGKDLATKAVTNTSPFANITAIGIYSADTRNTAFINTYAEMFLDGNTAELNQQIALMASMSNGSSMLGQLALTIDAISFDTIWDKDNSTETTNTSTVATASASLGTHTWHSIQNVSKIGEESTVTSRVTQVGKVGQQISAKLTVMDHGTQARMYQLGSFELRPAQDQLIATDTVNDVTMAGTLETDPAVEGQLWQAGNQEELIAKAAELGIDTNDEQAMEDLRNGFYTDANGQTFAIVSANNVNIMDGNGFRSAEGETVMVAVDNATKERVVNNVKQSGDRSVMFMGDVRESSTGYLTMTMNTNYGGGVVTGSAAIETAKADIAQKSQAVAQAREQLEAGTISQSEFDKIVEDAGWVGNNTAENLDKFAKGNYSWDQNKTATQNLRDAWDLLLNF